MRNAFPSHHFEARGEDSHLHLDQFSASPSLNKDATLFSDIEEPGTGEHRI